MSDTTTVRTTIRDAIAAALGLDFVDGKIDGPLANLSVGCTWPDSQSVAEGDANFVEFRFVARVLIANDARVTETDPQDPADLEAIAQSIAMTVGTVASTTLANTYVTVHGAEYDVDANSVDVMISAHVVNPFDPG